MQDSNTVPALTQTLGLDLGDRRSSLCLISAKGTVLEEGEVPTTRGALMALFGRLEPWPHRHRGVRSRALGREARRRGRTRGHRGQSSRASTDLEEWSEERPQRPPAPWPGSAASTPELLRPIRLRGDACRATRALLHARDQLVRMRTKLVTFTRGQVKSFGGRVPSCSAESFHKRAGAHVPELLREVVGPVLEVLAQLEVRIRNFDKEIERVSDARHPETKVLRQVRGVGPVLALAYAATIEDPSRFSSSRTVGNYVGLGSETVRLGREDTRAPHLQVRRPAPQTPARECGLLHPGTIRRRQRPQTLRRAHRPQWLPARQGSRPHRRSPQAGVPAPSPLDHGQRLGAQLFPDSLIHSPPPTIP